MKDDFAREIRYLRLSVTDLCNYRCQYCMPPQGIQKQAHGSILSVEECIEMARAAVALGIDKIRITGGEPLVRRGILDICRGIGALPGLKELCLTTNGALLQKFALPLLDAGVQRLNISLDTLRPDRFAAITRGGDLNAVRAGLDAAREAGFTNIKLNTVLIGGFNVDEIADFIQITREIPLQVRFIELMPLGECAQWEAARFVPADAVLTACPALTLEGQSGVSALYRVPGYAGTVGLIRPLSGSFCHLCNRIRITADGKLKPCLHSALEIPLRSLQGAQLEEAMRAGILRKPRQHHLENGSDAGRAMHQIGG
ncbi:MAG: GTP 3',8-cyclase MoaA [Christensenellaceae bacterium]|jgi:cyclic pyranopterin phosphate synthase|nr:GTP 3',8-cyclase MoaA [Christensenellaceae bacterium]